MKRTTSKTAGRRRPWTARELRLVDRLAAVHGELGALHRERAALIAYVSRLHAGSVTAPDRTGWRLVHVDTAVGRLSWRVAPDDTELLSDTEGAPPPPGAPARPGAPEPAGAFAGREDTATRLSFLHLHRRPNRPARMS